MIEREDKILPMKRKSGVRSIPKVTINSKPILDIITNALKDAERIEKKYSANSDWEKLDCITAINEVMLKARAAIETALLDQSKQILLPLTIATRSDHWKKEPLQVWYELMRDLFVHNSAVIECKVPGVINVGQEIGNKALAVAPDQSSQVTLELTPPVDTHLAQRYLVYEKQCSDSRELHRIVDKSGETTYCVTGDRIATYFYMLTRESRASVDSEIDKLEARKKRRLDTYASGDIKYLRSDERRDYTNDTLTSVALQDRRAKQIVYPCEEAAHNYSRTFEQTTDFLSKAGLGISLKKDVPEYKYLERNNHNACDYVLSAHATVDHRPVTFVQDQMDAKYGMPDSIRKSVLANSKKFNALSLGNSKIDHYRLADEIGQTLSNHLNEQKELIDIDRERRSTWLEKGNKLDTTRTVSKDLMAQELSEKIETFRYLNDSQGTTFIRNRNLFKTVEDYCKNAAREHLIETYPQLKNKDAIQIEFVSENGSVPTSFRDALIASSSMGNTFITVSCEHVSITMKLSCLLPNVDPITSAKVQHEIDSSAHSVIKTYVNSKETILKTATNQHRETIRLNRMLEEYRTLTPNNSLQHKKDLQRLGAGDQLRIALEREKMEKKRAALQADIARQEKRIASGNAVQHSSAQMFTYDPNMRQMLSFVTRPLHQEAITRYSNGEPDIFDIQDTTSKFEQHLCNYKVDIEKTVSVYAKKAGVPKERALSYLVFDLANGKIAKFHFRDGRSAYLQSNPFHPERYVNCRERLQAYFAKPSIDQDRMNAPSTEKVNTFATVSSKRQTGVHL